MAYNFIGLTNDVNNRLNEVQLTSSNFATVTGYFAFAKDAVNSAIVSTLKKGTDFVEAEDVILPVGKVVESAAASEYTIS